MREGKKKGKQEVKKPKAKRKKKRPVAPKK